MKRKTFSYFGAGALVAVSLVVACGGDDSATGLTAAGGAAGAGGGATGGSAGVAGKAGAGAAAGKAGTGGQATGGTSSGGAAGKPAGGAGGQAAGAGGQITGGTSSGGAAGKPSGGAGGQVAGAGGSGTAGSGTAGSGTAGSGTAGSGTAGSGTAGAAGDGSAGAAGDGSAGAAGDGSAGAAGDGSAGAAGDGSAGTGGAGTAGAGGTVATGGSGGAPAGCTGTDTACATPSGAQGLCRNTVCEACAEPADDAVCATAYKAGDRCLAGSCGTCDAVGTTYVVDPINGSDTIANGSGTSGGAASSRCAFKTVTAAIKAIGANAAAATLTIAIAGPSTLDAAEVYPLKVPTKTTVTATGGDVAIKITTDGRVFELSKDGASLDGGSFLLDIDASQQKGTTAAGVFVTTGATDASIIRHVRISETAGPGISVNGSGRVTIQEGVNLRKSGRGNAARAGLAVSDTAFATLVAPAAAAPILIEEAGVGISVQGGAAIKLTGVPDANAPDKGTIVVLKSLGPGVAISQIAGIGGAPALNDIFGLVSYGNGAGANGGSGLRATYISNVKLRSSVLLANKSHGVHVATADGFGPLAVDLGSAADAGHNVVQHANAQGNINLGAGVCLSPGGAVNLTLPARGNVFGLSDCAITAATLVKGNNGQGACSQGRDYGIDLNNPTNTIDVTMCK
jgi:hypothetical protein